MGRESLWGWFSVGVLLSMLAAFLIVIASSTPLLLAGVLLGIVAGVMLQVTTIALGVQIGMARHEFLGRRRG